MTTEEPKENFTAAGMKNRPSEEDQIRMVIKNLQPHYLRHFYPQVVSDFKRVHVVRQQVEDGFNLGLLDKNEPPQARKPSQTIAPPQPTPLTP